MFDRLQTELHDETNRQTRLARVVGFLSDAGYVTGASVAAFAGALVAERMLIVVFG